jgi:hypothetical protein
VTEHILVDSDADDVFLFDTIVVALIIPFGANDNE